MDVSQGVKTDVRTANGMMLPVRSGVVAGPCTVESYEQFLAGAKAVKQAGLSTSAAAPSNPAPHLTPSRASARRA